MWFFFDVKLFVLFFVARNATRFIPRVPHPEVNFWILLLFILEFSPLSEKIILCACFLGFLFVILNFFFSLFRASSDYLQERFLFLFLNLLMIFLPQVIIFLIPLFLFKVGLATFLASFFLVFTGLLWILPWNQEKSYSALLQKILPFFTFLLLLSSVGYWFYFSNLLISYFFILTYNASFLKDFFLEEWTPMILRSSFLWNFFRFFLPLPLISEVFVSTEILVLCGPTILGLLKVQALATKPSGSGGFARFLDLHVSQRPRFLNTGLATTYLNKVNKVIHITEALEKQLSFLFEEFSKTDGAGYPSEILRKSIQDFPIKRLDPFLRSNNFFGSREFLHFLFLKVFFADKLVVPSTLLYPSEAIPTLKIHDRV